MSKITITLNLLTVQTYLEFISKASRILPTLKISTATSNEGKILILLEDDNLLYHKEEFLELILNTYSPENILLEL